MSRVAAYRAAMLDRRAAKAGCTVAELLARGEREAIVTRRVAELRYGDRREARDAIARAAAGWCRRRRCPRCGPENLARAEIEQRLRELVEMTRDALVDAIDDPTLN